MVLLARAMVKMPQLLILDEPYQGLDRTNRRRLLDAVDVIGHHRGHAVKVGDWKLVHLTDPSTCHCVLSRLDEATEIPAIMSAISPGLQKAANPTNLD